MIFFLMSGTLSDGKLFEFVDGFSASKGSVPINAKKKIAINLFIIRHFHLTR